ncbi:MAG: IS5 family transposase [Rhodobacteraceae bacterium]|nr:IS5 family transposase [Paracoccaceae bacterium]
MSGDRHDMSDAEWKILRSVLSHKHQGPERVHDRRVMNGIFFVLRTGTPWRDLPERYGPYTTCFNRYNRWSRNGIWAAIMEKLQRLAGDDDGGDDGPPGSVRLRMVDSSSVRVHQHGAGAPRGRRATAGRAEPRRTDDEGPSRHRRARDGEDRVPDPGPGSRLRAGGGASRWARA